MHSGLGFAFPRSYNLPPPSLVTRLICLYSGAALVITQQEWRSKDRTISITGSKRILETRGMIHLDTHRSLDCSKAHLFQPRLIIIALARMASDRWGTWITGGGTRYFTAGVTTRCYRSSGSIRRPRSSSASIQWPRSHQANEMDGQMFQIAESARSPPTFLSLDGYHSSKMTMQRQSH